MTASYPSSIPDYTGEVGGAGDPLDTPDHSSHHTNVADDVEAIATELGTNASTFATTVRAALESHGSRHQDGGADEINVAGLSGDLADPQDPKGHATTHEEGGSDLVKRTLLSRIAAGTTQTISTPCSLVGCTASGITITLASAMVTDGAWIDVVDESGAAGTSAITVDTEGSETIDGAASQTIGVDHGQLRVYSDGTNWFTR